jgi:hypothetical protein
MKPFSEAEINLALILQLSYKFLSKQTTYFLLYY